MLSSMSKSRHKTHILLNTNTKIEHTFPESRKRTIPKRQKKGNVRTKSEDSELENKNNRKISPTP